MLPNFLCIGAQKSGTTTLLRQLGRHPDIFMSPARETRFFLRDDLYSQGLSSYELEYFADWNGQRAVGEKTPEYLCNVETPGRIAASLGNAMKLVASFRSPAQRAYAHYRHNFQHLWEYKSFEEALAVEAERIEGGRDLRLRYGYLWRGRYAEQLARYFEHFHRDAFFFIVYEQDIAQRQVETLRALFGFLEVDAKFDPGADVSAGRAETLVPSIIDTDREVDLPELNGDVHPGDILFRRQGIKPRLVRRPSTALQERVRAALRHLPRETSLNRERELEINRRHFRDDIRRLEQIVGRQLGSWLE